VLRLTREHDDLVVEHDSFTLALRKEGGVYRQYLHSARGARPLLLRSDPGRAGEDGVLVPWLDSLQVAEEPRQLRLQLSGSRGSHRFLCTLTLREGENWIHVVCEDRPTGPTPVETLTSSYRLARRDPDFVFAPYIRPFDDMVIGQSGFKSPVIAWLAQGTLLLLAADTELLNAAPPPLPAYLDLDAELAEPRLGFGLTTHRPAGFLYFRHTPGESVQVGPEPFRYGYYLAVEEPVAPEEAASRTARFLWARLAAPYLGHALPQVAPFERYARQGLDYILSTLWTEFDLDGKRCGGVRSGLRFPNDIWFQNQHDGLESALGLHYLGALWHDQELCRKASCTKNLILASPCQRGLFSTVFAGNVRFGVLQPEWRSSSHWMSPDIVGEFATVSPQALAGLINWDRVYHTVSLSTTAHKMLVWYQEAEADPELVARSRAYAEQLLRLQQHSGAIPSFIYRDSFEIDTLLMESVDSACSGMFLAELYRVTRDERYLKGAVRVAEFILGEIRPGGRWQDYETNLDSLAKPVGFYDRHTRQYAQTCGGMFWSAELFRILAETTGAAAWQTAGAQIADYLSLFQAVWSPHFLSMHCFGGLAVGNSHPAWSDARQQQVGRMFLRYYALTHDTDYLTRGLAAIRSGLPLMYLPENARVARHYANGPAGVCLENYAHRGQDKAAITCCSDWGLGNLLPALALLEREYGTLVVDLERGQAFGVDGVVVRSCRVTEGRVELAVDDEVGQGRPMTVTLLGQGERSFEVSLNGRRLGAGRLQGGKLRLGGASAPAAA